MNPHLIVAAGIAASAGLISAVQVQAGTIVQCGEDVCSSDFTVKFNDNDNAGGGQLLYDAVTGDISLNLDGKTLQRGKDFRYGHRPGLETTDLIIWIKADSESPVTFSVQGM